jgi:nicotinamidase/pyrazinamidase
VTGGAAAVSRIDSLLKSDHGYDYLIATRDHHIDPGLHFADEPDFVDSWPRHCVAGSPGSEFHDNLTFRDFSAVFYKGHYAPPTPPSRESPPTGETVQMAARSRS